MTEYAQEVFKALDAVREQHDSRRRGGASFLATAQWAGVSPRMYRAWCKERGIPTGHWGTRKPAAAPVKRVSAAKILSSHTQELLQMLGDGMLYKDIAARLGVTKNSISGWVYRHQKAPHIQARPPKPKASKPKTSKPKTSKPKAAPARLPVGLVVSPGVMSLTTAKFPEPLNGQGVPFADAGDMQCQRPLWSHHESNGSVCGLPVKDKSRYCPECHAVFFVFGCRYPSR